MPAEDIPIAAAFFFWNLFGMVFGGGGALFALLAFVALVITAFVTITIRQKRRRGD